MSRAVPSPPAKRIRSTLRRASSAAAARVSSAVVTCSLWRFGASTSVSKACPRARSAPMTPAAATTLRPAHLHSSRASVRSARSAATGTAPRARACSRTSAPSVPFSPTRPPIPAIGLTISPTRPIDSGLASQLGCHVVDGLPCDPNELADLVLRDHERRRERDGVGSRQRACDEAQLETAACDASGDLERRVEWHCRILPRHELECRDQRGSPHLADERVVVERLAEESVHLRPPLRCPGDEPLVLDHVQVRHRDGGRNRSEEHTSELQSH